MKSKHQRIREAIYSYIKKIIKENTKEQSAAADAEWMADKITTALDAATNKDKDYQYVAAFDSDKLKKLAQDLKKEKQNEQALKETFFDWLAGGVRNWGNQIIDRRAGYLQKALNQDPKLQRMAKDFGISNQNFEKTIYNLMGKDTSFLKDLASGKMRAKSAYRF